MWISGGRTQDGLSDFDEPHTDGVVDEAVAEVTLAQVIAQRLDRMDDVIEAGCVAAAQFGNSCGQHLTAEPGT